MQGVPHAGDAQLKGLCPPQPPTPEATIFLSCPLAGDTTLDHEPLDDQVTI